MANEINIQAVLTVQMANSPAMQAAGTKDITQTAKRCSVNVQNIGTSAELLTYGDVATVKYVLVKNMDATNYVQLALDSGFTQIFAKMLPGEFCLIPTNQNNVYARANTTAVDCCVCAADT